MPIPQRKTPSLLRACLRHSPQRHCALTAALTVFLGLVALGFAAPGTTDEKAPPATVPTKKPTPPQEVTREPVREAADLPTIQKFIPEADEKKTSPSVGEICIKIGAKLNSVRQDDCLTSGLQSTGSHSVNGWPILMREFPPMPGKPPIQARILILGGVHGDEYSSVSIVFKWMKTLAKHHTGLFHWRIAPLVNPDGLLREPSSRVNAHGVDLNRNFPTRDWKNDSTDYWVRRTGKDPRRFPGYEPLSEPESLWIFQEIEQFRPNVIVSVHAPFGLLDFDGPPSIPPEKLGHIYLSLLGTYPGSLGRYAGENLKTPILTIELPSSGTLPTEEQTTQIWMDLVQWLRTHAHDRTKSSTPTPPAEAPTP